MGKPTLSSLAEACGVSTATVSRALAGHPAVLAATRARVAAVARAHRQIMAGAKDRARKLGFQLDSFSMGQDGLDAAGYARVLRARGVKGVVLIYTDPTDAMAGFPWHEFATVEIDYGQTQPVLHTVCLDQYMTLHGALVRLQTEGYRRIGLFLERFKDERIARKWSAPFLAIQHGTRAIGAVPPLVVERMEAAPFLRWHRRYRPDLVIGHVDDAVGWLEHAGVRVPAETAFFNLNWNVRRRPCAGLDLRMELQGSVAVETLIAQIQRGERGLPDEPRTIMVRGRWVDGPTLRARAGPA